MREITLRFETKRFRLFSDGQIQVICHELATKLNKLTKRYDAGKYRFEIGEEGIFYMSQIERTAFIHKIMGITSAQMLRLRVR